MVGNMSPILIFNPDNSLIAMFTKIIAYNIFHYYKGVIVHGIRHVGPLLVPAA